MMVLYVDVVVSNHICFDITDDKQLYLVQNLRARCSCIQAILVLVTGRVAPHFRIFAPFVDK